MHPWPGAFTSAGKRTLKVLKTHVVDRHRKHAEPGEVLLADKARVVVACGAGAVELVSVQPEGKRVMQAGDWVIGRGVSPGERLGAPSC
jgi:methionyl-tRNA formyltransferase